MLCVLSSVAVPLQGRPCNLNWVVIAVNGESSSTFPKANGQVMVLSISSGSLSELFNAFANFDNGLLAQL